MVSESRQSDDCRLLYLLLLHSINEISDNRPKLVVAVCIVSVVLLAMTAVNHNKLYIFSVTEVLEGRNGKQGLLVSVRHIVIAYYE